MRRLLRVADRVVPPLLLAAGVTLVGAGLLSYARESVAAPSTVAERTALPADPAAVPGGSPAPSPGTPHVSPQPTATGSGGPVGPIPTDPPPSPDVAGEVTRVVVPSLGIDLPVLSRLDRVRGQGPDRYPPCDVALYHDAFVQPAEEGTTYVYAHAQEGMFLPLLEASRRRDGEALIGALVQLYTSDDRVYLYRIDRVKRHALDFSIAEAAPGERQLVLQTSEGPFGTFEKVQVAAAMVGQTAAEPGEAQPRARPRACYPG